MAVVRNMRWDALDIYRLADGMIVEEWAGNERLPRSRLDIIDAGHFTWGDAADEYAAIVASWWAESTRPLERKVQRRGQWDRAR